MKVTGLDGKSYRWSKSKYLFGNHNKTSKLHKKCRKLLNDIFPYSKIFEEVYLPGTEKLYADFLVWDRRLVVEVHGIQHYEYNSFFFKNKMEFFRAQGRDKKKIEWCDLNDIEIVILDGRKENEWKSIIDSFLRGETQTA